MSLPRLMTILQFKQKYPVEFKSILTFPLTEAYKIPGMLSANPDLSDVQEWNGLLEALIDYIGRKYANCIFYMPVDDDSVIDVSVEANATTMVTALSINQKYRNLCATLANIDEDNLVGESTPSEWYLHNYKVAYTGTESVAGSGNASAKTGLKTEKTRQIATLEKGTSGETTATLRDVSLVAPSALPGVVEPKDTDTTTGALGSDNTSSITASSSNATTTYNTQKEGYYNTGNKTTILKDVQDLTVNSPFFKSWLDEIMESIVIPVYASTFGCKTERF